MLFHRRTLASAFYHLLHSDVWADAERQGNRILQPDYLKKVLGF
ncbi:hypothetical protein [Porphyromonas sp.]